MNTPLQNTILALVNDEPGIKLAHLHAFATQKHPIDNLGYLLALGELTTANLIERRTVKRDGRSFTAV